MRELGARIRYGTCQNSTCGTGGCKNEALIVCRFQSLAIKELGPPIKRFDHEAERAWCWPCFVCWTERLKSLARRGWGLADGLDGRWAVNSLGYCVS